MPGYQIFNPENDRNMNANARVSDLPPNVRARVEHDLESALIWRMASSSEQEIRDSLELRMTRARISELEGEGLDVDSIMDAWAEEMSFDPARVTVEEACWVMYDEQGRQHVTYSHLVEAPKSINGHAWEIEEHSFSDEEQKWKLDASYKVDGRGVTSATGAFGVNIGSERTRSAYRDMHENAVRIPPGWWTAAGLDGPLGALANEPISPQLIKAAAGADWDVEDLPTFPTWDDLEIDPRNLEREEGNVFEIERKVGPYDIAATFDVDRAAVETIIVYVPSEEGAYITRARGADVEQAYNICRKEVLTYGEFGFKPESESSLDEAIGPIAQSESLTLTAEQRLAIENAELVDEIAALREIISERDETIAGLMEKINDATTPNVEAGLFPAAEQVVRIDRVQYADMTKEELTARCMVLEGEIDRANKAIESLQEQLDAVYASGYSEKRQAPSMNVPGMEKPAKAAGLTVGKDASDMKANRNAGHEVGAKKQGRGL